MFIVAGCRPLSGFDVEPSSCVSEEHNTSDGFIRHVLDRIEGAEQDLLVAQEMN